MTTNNNEINATVNSFITVFIMSSVGSNSFSIHELRIVRREQRHAIHDHVRYDFMMSFYFIRFLYRINLNIFYSDSVTNRLLVMYKCLIYSSSYLRFTPLNQSAHVIDTLFTHDTT